jgi:hypothetical protein
MVDAPTVVTLLTQFPLVRTNGDTQLTVPFVIEIVADVFPAVTPDITGVAGTSNFHCAYNVVAAKSVTTSPSMYETPDPFAAVFQPSNEYPERV